MPGNTAHEYEGRESVKEVVDASRRLLDTDERPIRRDQHPKQHGCVRARFLVANGVGGPKVLANERDATTQDFVMVDNPTFFLRDAVEYSRFSELLLKAKGKEP